MNIENKLLEMFDLQVVRIVRYTRDYASLKKRLGEAAANIFEEEVAKRDSPSVGVGGGSTLYEMVEHLGFRPRKIRIYPMAMIGRGPEIEYVDSVYLVTSIFYKSLPAGKGFAVGIPPLPKNRASAINFSRHLLDEIPEIKLVYGGAKNVDIAFVGAGAVIPTGDFSDELSKLGVSIQSLRVDGAIGGINYNWSDKDGNQIGNYFITIGIEDLRTLSCDPSKLIVLVAGGEHKLHMIKTALSTKMVNAIVTDDLIGRCLISGEDTTARESIPIKETIEISSAMNYTLLPLERIPCSISSVGVSQLDTLRIKITDQCPFSCEFCHKEGGSASQDLILSGVFLKALRRMVDELNIHEVHLTGGEPTCHPDCVSLVTALRGMGLQVKMTSNGQFDQELLQALASSGLESINLSIHTLQPGILASIQSPPRSLEWGKRALERQLTNLRAAKEIGLRVKVNTVVQDDVRDAKNIIALCASEGLDLRLLNDLTLGSLSVTKIMEILESLDSEIEGIDMVDGSSSYSFQVVTGSDFHFSVKAIRKSSLRSMCSYCSIRDQCEEWFYGIRIEQIHDQPVIRLCLHRQDYPAVQRMKEFFDSDQYEEIRQLAMAEF